MSAAFVAVVSEDGTKLHFDAPAQFREYVAKFAAAEVVISVKKRPRRQGTQQLRYLRGVVIPDIAQACGYTDPDDYQSVYDGLMWKFFRLPDGPFGEPRRESASKETMSLERMKDVIDTLITYAETTIPNCRIRRPEEIDMDDVVDQEFDA
jgi:hypothetical protein